MSETAEKFQAVLNLPFGRVGISMHQGRLVGVDYLDDPIPPYRSQAKGLEPVLKGIEHYMKDAQSDFDVDIELTGTPFQQQVWRELQAIPAGQTLTYGQLAERIGSGARAVGNACRANPCPLVIPCHRVVAASGLGGFAGQRSGRKLEVKRWLLQHEGWL
ncbi:MAG: methylated-DNA--[protein]-cysteine S-methyltransferase [Candidatus Thiodiazotropha sp.]|jgi:methylated-DNA-[protein]-cysteine S-methyltransferase